MDKYVNKQQKLFGSTELNLIYQLNVVYISLWGCFWGHLQIRYNLSLPYFSDQCAGKKDPADIVVGAI